MLATLMWISRSNEQMTEMLAQKAGISRFIAGVGTVAPFSSNQPTQGNVRGDTPAKKWSTLLLLVKESQQPDASDC